MFHTAHLRTALGQLLEHEEFQVESLKAMGVKSIIWVINWQTYIVWFSKESAEEEENPCQLLGLVGG